MLNLVTPGYAQEHAPAEGSPAMQDAAPHEGAEAHGGGEHGGFPPFDPATWGSQVFWLAITFGALLLLMRRVALPRIGGILEDRANRIAGDLAEAGRLKEETDAAIAAYEQALAEARQNGHAIAAEGARQGEGGDRCRPRPHRGGRCRRSSTRPRRGSAR